MIKQRRQTLDEDTLNFLLGYPVWILLNDGTEVACTREYFLLDPMHFRDGFDDYCVWEDTLIDYGLTLEKALSLYGESDVFLNSLKSASGFCVGGPNDGVQFI